MRTYTKRLVKCSDCEDHNTANGRECHSPLNMFGTQKITENTTMKGGFPSWCPLDTVENYDDKPIEKVARELYELQRKRTGGMA